MVGEKIKSSKYDYMVHSIANAVPSILSRIDYATNPGGAGGTDPDSWTPGTGGDGSGTGKLSPPLVSTTSRLRLPSLPHRSCSSFLPSFYSSWLPSGIFGTADIVYTFAEIIVFFNQVLGEILQLPSTALYS